MNREPIYQSVISIEDHKLLANGLELAIGHYFHHFYHASDLDVGLKMTRTLKPDLVIIDYFFPENNAEQTIKGIKYYAPESKILVYSFTKDQEVIIGLYKSGIDGYLLKGEGEEELDKAIRKIMLGDQYFCAYAKQVIKSTTLQEIGALEKIQYQGIEFSIKELEIIKLICKQKTAKEIAGLVYLSERTVEQYRSNIIKKIGEQNIAGIIKFALKNKILTIEDL